MATKILFYGFDVESDLAPYSSTSEYKGDKFAKILSKMEKKKSELKNKDQDTDALVVYGEWIDRPKNTTDTEWREIIRERTDFVNDEENFYVIEVE